VRDVPTALQPSAFSELQRERPQVRVVFHGVEKDRASLTRLQKLVTQQGGGVLGVPAFLVRGTLIIGYQGDATTGVRLKALLDTPPGARLREGEIPDSVCAPDAGSNCVAETTTSAVAEDIVGFCCKVSFSEVLGYCLSLRVAVEEWWYDRLQGEPV